MKTHKIGSYFSGIGGIDLAFGEVFRRRGIPIEHAYFCEIEDYPRRILARHWPEVEIYQDITKVEPNEIIKKHGEISIIHGGFPCQDISIAGKGDGLAGARSGLFYELMRQIRGIRPRYVFLENVPAILIRGRGLDRVLWELSTAGDDAEWGIVSARQVGARHLRKRWFCIATPNPKYLPF